MPDNNKPLFSRPVLTLVMFFCILAIWVLNLASSNSKLPSPNIETWTTTSGIPVIWLKQSEWKNSNKLEVRFSFHSNTNNTTLVQTTFAILMSDSLSLSTATINQRLEPLAARASSYYDHENQVIGLTLSNEPQYLQPTLSLITNWLSQPAFKQRTFDTWQHQKQINTSAQSNRELTVYSNTVFSNTTSKQNSQTVADLSLIQVSDFYQDLQHSAGTIFVVGDLSTEAKQTLEVALNTISQNFQLSQSITEPDQNTKASSIALATEGQYLWQTKSAMALAPISSIQEWLSLQIWGADLVSTLNQQEHIDFVQLALTLSQHQPWTEWNIQYANHFTEKAKSNTSNNIMDAISFTSIEKVPSANDEVAFELLFNSFKTQLEQQVQSPTWWSYIATQVTHENSQLTIEEFVNDYKQAVDNFTIEEYQTALKQLLKPSSYQEIQVYQ
ncbi:hypothetical protein MUS1_00135 [Marinomonas ushuaiensis DSM 15871]|uniref:Peptidase M16 C-terminal domain-containing protein n=1 Tax=Marinomonas ushuaiensis DSM 15871 TaxID=1122207 RepID=X7E7K7_9GAMM|nr:hypothetical protein [Marinomonas ushuaiensis]ETX12054.1 hypothetical protein MUS1_00135 [Marinomonas ushuaiensis DSM 15871]